MNPPEGSIPDGSGQNPGGTPGDVINPWADIKLPWLSSTKYAHSDGFGPPLKNTVSKSSKTH